MKAGDLVVTKPDYWDTSPMPQHQRRIWGLVQTVQLHGLAGLDRARVRWPHGYYWERIEALEVISESR